MANFFAKYPVSGGGGGVTSLNTLTGALTLVGGVNVIITPSGGNTLTIDANAISSIGPIDTGTPSANGAQDVANVLIMQSASATKPGLVNNAVQTFSGNKTFTGSISASNLSGTNTGDVTIGTASGLSLAGQVLSLALATSSTPGAVLNIGSAFGVASLDASGKVPFSELPSALMVFLGAWDASTNTPTLADGTGVAGDTYRVSVAGTQNLGSGAQTFFVGDFLIYNGSIWQRSPAADGVISVNGASGAVTVNAINQLTGDVTTAAASQSQSEAATIAAIQGTTVSGTTGSGNVVFSASPTLTGTITAAAANFSSNISAANLSGTNTGDVTLAAVGAAPSANGASLAAQVLTLQPADGTHPGLLTSGAQTIGGAKTFTGAISASNLSGTNTGDQTITLTGGVTGSGTGSFAATVVTNADLTGDVTSVGNATTIANNAVTTAKINNSAVTYAKIQNASANSILLGSGSAGSGSPLTEITLGSGLLMTSTTLSTTDLRTINAQSGTTYTLVLADGSGAGGKPLLTLSNASPVTVTVPPNSSVAFPIGTQVDAIQQGAGKVTFAQGSGVTINSLGSNKSINGQYVGISLIKTATDTWTLMGNLTA